MSDYSDPKDVARAEQTEKLIRKQELDDIKTVLANASGRRLIWKLLSKCNVYGSIFDSDNSTMCYLSGKQDLGHFLVAEITQADENLLFKLMKENKKGDM